MKKVTHVSLWNAPVGGVFQAAYPLDVPKRIRKGVALIGPGETIIRVNPSPGSTTEENVARANAIAAASTHIQAHSGDPGPTGTDHVISGLARQAAMWGRGETEQSH